MKLLYDFVMPEKMRRNLPALQEQGVFADPWFLVNGIYVGLALCILRLLLNKFVFRPLADVGLKLPKVDVPKQRLPHLDLAMRKLRHIPSSEEIRTLSINSGITDIEAKEYLRAMRRMDVRQVKIMKFTEAAWRFVMYLAALCYGVWTLYDVLQQYVSDPTHKFFFDWPNHERTPATDKYYLFGVGIYIHLLLFQAFDIKRSDWLANTFHHFITLSLLYTSWVLSFSRIGCFIMLLHDTSDVFLEIAKIFNYLKVNPACKYWAKPAADYAFVLFAVSFYVNRLYFYPKCALGSMAYILYCDVVHNISTIEFTRNMAIGFASLLALLMALNIMWSYLILQMILKVLNTKEELEDVRSDDENDWDSSSDEEVDKMSNSSNRKNSNGKKND
eukprot:376661_1